MNFYKDEDLSLFESIGNSTLEENLEPESSDYLSTQVYSNDNELYTYSIRNIQNSLYKADHLYTDSYNIPYLIPDQSLGLLAALLVVAIRSSVSDNSIVVIRSDLPISNNTRRLYEQSYNPYSINSEFSY